MTNSWATSAGDPPSKIGIDLHMDLTGARSDVVLLVISGVLLMRRVVGARALDERNADHLVELLEAVFGAVVDTRLS